MTTPATTPEAALASSILRVLRATRLPLTGEKETQTEASKAFVAAGLVHDREVDLGGGDIVDFFFPLAGGSDGQTAGVAVEFKLRAQKSAVYRQCDRYAAHDQVSALILATATAMGFPETLNGKPCYLANLGRAWL